ncbi:type IV toxin-antitoxin system AbiEi family antitoxin [Microbacterium sp. NPDC089189]|uniref:type IV toxin-antitoxin system AbiEi family antitoxin n=1 Tax=Microbacterium sp. NPDC089189 TaxID=3154972 RepID=UPI0034132B93
MRSVFLYFAGDRLSTAELTAACLDGHLVGLGEGFIPADTIETASLRAASLAELLGTQLAATHESAAWVHGIADDPPARHRVQRTTPRRLHEPVGRRFVYRDPQIPDHDLVTIGGVRVTSAPRTIVDLARSADGAPALLTRWAREDVDAVRAAGKWVQDSHRIPHRRVAIERIDAALRTT